MPWIEIKPVIDLKVRALCKHPYYNHRNGCPNFSKKEGCPPSAPLINDILDLSKPIFAIYNIFDLFFHVQKMRKKHPLWSYRQLSCCLYWQPTARKQLREEIRKFLKKIRLKIVNCPEAQGVNLTESMKNAGIILEWPPKKYAYQIVLAGHKKN